MTVTPINVLTADRPTLAEQIAAVELVMLAETEALRAAAGSLGNADDPQWWTVFSLCAQTDPELFTATQGPDATTARDICADCDVSAQCREYALERRERFGIWGGLTAADRRKVLAASGVELPDDTDADLDDEAADRLDVAS